MYNITEGFNLNKFQGFSKTMRKPSKKTEFDNYLEYKLAEKARQYKMYKEAT